MRDARIARMGLVYYICPTCDGQGGMGDDCICPDCDGAGHVQAHVIGDGVMALERLSAASKAMTDYLGVQFVWKSYTRLTEEERGIVREAARLALEAAGVKCADGYIVVDGPQEVYESDGTGIVLDVGDTIYIVRAKEGASESGA